MNPSFQPHSGSATPLCRIDAIPDGDALGVDTLGENAISLILLRRGEQVFAYYNECPHAGRRLEWAQGRFLVRDGVLTCAVHGASFTIDNGRCCGGLLCGDLAAASIILRDGDVWLAEDAS